MARRKSRQHVSPRSKKQRRAAHKRADQARPRIKARCPCCGKNREVGFLVEYLPHSESDAATQAHWCSLIANSGWTRWACQECLGHGRAIRARTDLQVYCCATRFLAYFDWERGCTDCGSSFVFASGEQRFWYETLKFIPDSIPNQCVPCRRKRREQQDSRRLLAEALPKVDPSNAASLAAVADLYARCGHVKKAAEFYRRAKNRSEDAVQIAEWMARVEAMIGGDGTYP